MRRSKKFILVTVLATVVLVGSITGVVLAQNGDDSQPKAGPEALLEKVCEVYEENTGTAIDSQELGKAFAQAQSEVRNEAIDVNQPEALLARVAEILGIEQQDLQDAFAQAHSEIGEGAPWQRPANGTPGSRGAIEK